MIDHTEALSGHERLAAVAAYDLDSPQLRERLDALATRTARALGQPVGLVNIVLDTAKVIAGSTPLPGWIDTVRGTPVEWSFCATTVVTDAPYVVADARTDAVQHDNPLVAVEGVASYAGVPLRTRDGHVLGAHCVLGLQPHAFTAEELALLESAAEEATAVLEEHRLPGR